MTLETAIIRAGELAVMLDVAMIIRLLLGGRERFLRQEASNIGRWEDDGAPPAEAVRRTCAHREDIL